MKRANLLRPFVWKPTGTPSERYYQAALEDDAVCRWHGLMLRYEQMDARRWWWAVYARSGRGDEVASSNDLGAPGHNHHAARLLAEGAAIRYLLRKGDK